MPVYRTAPYVTDIRKPTATPEIFGKEKCNNKQRNVPYVALSRNDAAAPEIFGMKNAPTAKDVGGYVWKSLYHR